MELFFNKNREIEVTGVEKGTTVEDFLEGNSAFLQKHPLSCFTCNDNCCRQGWDIVLDIVFANRYCQKKNNSLKYFFQHFVSFNALESPVFKQEICSFLSSEGKCQIYGWRPFICRAYTCYPESISYLVLRDIIVRGMSLLLSKKIMSEVKTVEIPQHPGSSIINVSQNDLLEMTAYNVEITQLAQEIDSFLSSREKEVFNRLLK